jgi:hypothetical protein
MGGELATDQPEIPAEQRPQPTSRESQDSSGDDGGVERHPSGRKVRSDKGSGRTKASGAQNRKAAAAKGKAATGAGFVYGGLGMILAGVGIAPAAGLVMQGLADEAGPELAAWAKDHSPRLYQFFASCADVGGPGKYVALPTVAEAHLRAPNMRPALTPPLRMGLDDNGVAALEQMEARYDEWKAAQEAERQAQHQAQAGADSPFPAPEPPT